MIQIQAIRSRWLVRALVPALVAMAFGASAAPITSAQDFPYIPLLEGQWSGTNGSDNLTGMPGRDIVHDGASNPGAPHRSDGARDNIDTSGDGVRDTIYCGPEDVLHADPDDLIIILSKDGKYLWSGSFKQYLELMKLMHRLRRLVFAQLPGAGPALAAVRAEHVEAIGKLTEASSDELLYQLTDSPEFKPMDDLTVFEAELPELALWFPASESDPPAEPTVMTTEELIALLDGVVNVIDELELQQP